MPSLVSSNSCKSSGTTISSNLVLFTNFSEYNGPWLYWLEGIIWLHYVNCLDFCGTVVVHAPSYLLQKHKGMISQIYKKIFLDIMPPIFAVLHSYCTNRTIPLNKKFQSIWEGFDDYSRYMSKNIQFCLLDAKYI